MRRAIRAFVEVSGAQSGERSRERLEKRFEAGKIPAIGVSCGPTQPVFDGHTLVIWSFSHLVMWSFRVRLRKPTRLSRLVKRTPVTRPREV